MVEEFPNYIFHLQALGQIIPEDREYLSLYKLFYLLPIKGVQMPIPLVMTGMPFIINKIFLRWSSLSVTRWELIF